MSTLFKVGEKLPKRSILYIEIAGLLLFLAVWYVITIPIEERSIGFNSSAPAGTIYQWEGPDGFSTDFNGDNMILGADPGEYSFTATDSLGCVVSGKVNVPDILDKKIAHTFENKCNNHTLIIDIEVKSTNDGLVSRAIIPPPLDVIKSFKDLHFDDKGNVRENTVVVETAYSVFLNIMGYVEAIVISLLLGFLVALVPFFRALLSRWVNAVRFIPLTAVTGLFIAWFGIASNMKIQFLAFGIFVYLMPIVVQRIDDVKKIHLQTAFTLGASTRQLIRTIYFPAVASKLIDDIRVLTAISWTYIIIAEMLNQTGGIGALIHLSGRESRLDKVFALLIIIVLIGILQDRLFAWMDKKFFKFKYQATPKH
jgi:NitT/TauT family transport system permease protein